MSKRKERKFLKAVDDGNVEDLQKLLSEGVNVNATDPDNWAETPLMKAAKKGHLHIVNALINNNADVNMTDENGTLPIHKASYWGYFDIVETLINAKTAINVQEKNGQTPLYWATEKNKDAIASVLIRNSADVNISTQDGYTPLHDACERGYDEITELLIGARAEVNAIDQAGLTPLHSAAYKGNDSVVKTLIKSAANVMVVEKNGYTAFELACRKAHFKVISTFILNAKNVNDVDEGGNTMFHILAAREVYEPLKYAQVLPAYDFSLVNLNGLNAFAIARRGQDPYKAVSCMGSDNFMFSQARFFSFYEDLENITEVITNTSGTTLYTAELNVGFSSKKPVWITVLCKVARHGSENEWHELQVLQNLPYQRNILGLLGMCSGFRSDVTGQIGQKQTAVIMNFKKGGPLIDQLRNGNIGARGGADARSPDALSLEHLLSLGIEMTSALIHLHANGYKHCDIAARNFLISIKDTGLPLGQHKQQHAVLWNFELTRPFKIVHSKSTMLPWRWCAPETLTDLTTSKASDIWMLGITFWELAVRPYCDPFHSVAMSCQDLKRRFKSENGLKYPNKHLIPTEWVEIIQACCSFQPDFRPSSVQLLERLERHLKMEKGQVTEEKLDHVVLNKDQDFLEKLIDKMGDEHLSDHDKELNVSGYDVLEEEHYVRVDDTEHAECEMNKDLEVEKFKREIKEVELKFKREIDDIEQKYKAERMQTKKDTAELKKKQKQEIKRIDEERQVEKEEIAILSEEMHHMTEVFEKLDPDSAFKRAMKFWKDYEHRQRKRREVWTK